VYPNGRLLTYNYTAAIDAAVSRLTSISDNSATLESLDYLGMGTVVRRAHSQPGVDLTYIKQGAEGNGDAGDQYTGLDRFGRVVDQRWIKTSDGSDTDRFKYGYDRDSNRLYRENLVNSLFSELYHADGATAGYDNLNQLKEFQRGALSDTNSDNIPDTVVTSSRSQAWTLDAQGNWSSLTTDGISVSRTHDKQNEVTAVGAATLTFDANGNLKTDQNGQQYVYDAWNRLVTVKNSGGTTIASYKYDALSHRIQQTVSGTTTDFYFSSGWQVLEERVSGTAKVQYVWSPVYVDALVERDRDADGNGANGLEERFYVQQDANFNVTAIINTSGSVVERYVYDPYGAPTFLSAGWIGPADGYSWRYLHQGGKFDSTTGLYNFGYRDESPTLGRWLQVDPLKFAAADTNLYRYEENTAPNASDPDGLRLLVRPAVQPNPVIQNPAHIAPPGVVFDPAYGSLRGARDDFIRVAQRMGLTPRQIQSRLDSIPPGLDYAGTAANIRQAIRDLARESNASAHPIELTPEQGRVLLRFLRVRDALGLTPQPQTSTSGAGAMRGGGRRRCPPPGSNLRSEWHHAIPHNDRPVNPAHNHQNHELVRWADVDLTSFAGNIRPLLGHRGPHTDAYHREVTRRLDEARDALAAVDRQFSFTAEERTFFARMVLEEVIQGIWNDIATGSLQPYPQGHDVYSP
jgi:RHS repeat-associated protein